MHMWLTCATNGWVRAGFVPYAGEGYALLIPSKWNPSKERDFPGTQLRCLLSPLPFTLCCHAHSIPSLSAQCCKQLQLRLRHHVGRKVLPHTTVMLFVAVTSQLTGVLAEQLRRLILCVAVRYAWVGVGCAGTRTTVTR